MDLREEKWRIERRAGNFPCTRTEDGFHICMYDFFFFPFFHPKRLTERKVEQGCHFEGFSPSMTTAYADKRTSSKSHTLLTISSIYPPMNQRSASASPQANLSPHPLFQRTRRQVITHGFPTYRYTAPRVTDDDTGRMYLFEGYVDSDFMPCRPDFVPSLWRFMGAPARCFVKTLQYRRFGGEIRTVKAGPYQRCFACSNAGPWRRCGGSLQCSFLLVMLLIYVRILAFCLGCCRGRAFFCGRRRLKDGWKEQKTIHGCRNTSS